MGLVAWIRRRFEANWQILALVTGAIYLVEASLFLFLGKHNVDEGWYLYASQLVLAGALPYRDFAYTQMPLLPYVYALGQALEGSPLYYGRVTSVMLSLIGLAAAFHVAYRYGGWRAAALNGLLFSSFLFGVYFMTLTKTYALVTCLLLLTLWLLTNRELGLWRYPLATITVGLAMATRLSVLPCFVIVLLYSLYCVRRVPVILLSTFGLSSAVLLSLTALFAQAPEAAHWNVIGHHAEQWGSADLATRLQIILTWRVPHFIQGHVHYMVLICVLGYALYKQVGQHMRVLVRRHSDFVAYGLAIGAFAGTNAVSGGWYLEYFVPVWFAGFPLVALASQFVLVQLGSQPRYQRGFAGLLATVMLVAPLYQSRPQFDVSGGQPPIEEIQVAAAFLAAHTEAQQPIFALAALAVVLEADRQTLPGMSMAQFSFEESPLEVVRRLHLVNRHLIEDYLATCAANYVVLTEQDFALFARHRIETAVAQHLNQRYDMVLELPLFGQTQSTIQIYACRP